MTNSEQEFAKSLTDGAKRESSVEFLHIYGVESEESLKNGGFIAPHRRTSRAKSIKKDYNYVEVDDATNCALIELSGNIQVIYHQVIECLKYSHSYF